jgi:8-oxo-dGTP pyrophosphatase MutT (NUDIX family)
MDSSRTWQYIILYGMKATQCLLPITLRPLYLYRHQTNMIETANLTTTMIPNAVQGHFAPLLERSALALIMDGVGANKKYLLQWNARWSVFNLIGGKVDNERGDKDSFLRAICREIEEEMGLIAPHDCYVVKELEHVFLKQHSKPDNLLKNYHFCIFAVEIFPDLPLNQTRPHTFARWLSTGRENVYVSAAEIARLYTHDHRPISTTTRTILKALKEPVT